MSEALLHYHLRVSPRARNIRLRVTAQRGLEVIVPKDYDVDKVPVLLQRRKAWIDTALQRAERHRKFFEPAPVWRVPHHIRLPAIGKFWRITIKKTGSPSVSVREVAPHHLVMFGRINHERAARAALCRWLSRQTREYLLPRLQQLSARTR